MVKGQKFEEQVAKYMGGRPIGGPGEPDYVRGSIQGEVKDWGKRMGKSAVKEEVGKGRNEIVSRVGFTDEAVSYRNQYQPKVKLIDWTIKKPV
jgi:hypothetical protein